MIRRCAQVICRAMDDRLFQFYGVITGPCHLFPFIISMQVLLVTGLYYIPHSAHRFLHRTVFKSFYFDMAESRMGE